MIIILAVNQFRERETIHNPPPELKSFLKLHYIYIIIKFIFSICILFLESPHCVFVFTCTVVRIHVNLHLKGHVFAFACSSLFTPLDVAVSPRLLLLGPKGPHSRYYRVILFLAFKRHFRPREAPTFYQIEIYLLSNLQFNGSGIIICLIHHECEYKMKLFCLAHCVCVCVGGGGMWIGDF